VEISKRFIVKAARKISVTGPFIDRGREHTPKVIKMETNESESDDPQFIVTGASGFLGSSVLAAAQSKGLKVLPVIRSREKGDLLGLERYILFQELSEQKLVNVGFDSSVIVHLIGNSRDDENCSLQQSIVATTKTVVAVAKQTGIRRIIYLSGYGITRDSSEAYFRLKAEAESIIQNSGIPYTLLRPSYILGPADEITPYLVQELEKGYVEIPGDGSYRFQPTYVEDMVDIIINAASLGNSESNSFDVLGPVISFSDYVKMLAARVAPEATLHYEKLETFIRRATLSADPIFTTGELAILICDIVGPVTKSCLGVRIRSLEETLDIWINQTAS
jgi:nucleoside-diphosphate-sugar epimerase